MVVFFGHLHAHVFFINQHLLKENLIQVSDTDNITFFKGKCLVLLYYGLGKRWDPMSIPRAILLFYAIFPQDWVDKNFKEAYDGLYSNPLCC